MWGDSVVLITLTATFLSNNADIQWDISRLAALVIFSSGVILPVVFYCEEWSKKAVIVFNVTGGIVMASPTRTFWRLALVSLSPPYLHVQKTKINEANVMSMTILLCLMKCKGIIYPVWFFYTIKCSATLKSPITNLSVAVVNGFWNVPITPWIWKMGGSSILKVLVGAYCLILCSPFRAIALT